MHAWHHVAGSSSTATLPWPCANGKMVVCFLYQYACMQHMRTHYHRNTSLKSIVSQPDFVGNPVSAHAPLKPFSFHQPTCPLKPLTPNRHDFLTHLDRRVSTWVPQLVSTGVTSPATVCLRPTGPDIMHAQHDPAIMHACMHACFTRVHRGVNVATEHPWLLAQDQSGSHGICVALTDHQNSPPVSCRSSQKTLSYCLNHQYQQAHPPCISQTRCWCC